MGRSDSEPLAAWRLQVNSHLKLPRCYLNTTNLRNGKYFSHPKLTNVTEPRCSLRENIIIIVNMNKSPCSSRCSLAAMQPSQLGPGRAGPGRTGPGRTGPAVTSFRQYNLNEAVVPGDLQVASENLNLKDATAGRGRAGRPGPGRRVARARL